MDLETARREVERLRQEIARHDVLYYLKDSPEIEDDAYDALMRRLIELEKAFPSLASENSPSRRVGGTPKKEMVRVSHCSAWKTPFPKRTSLLSSTGFQRGLAAARPMRWSVNSRLTASRCLSCTWTVNSFEVPPAGMGVSARM